MRRPRATGRRRGETGNAASSGGAGFGVSDGGVECWGVPIGGAACGVLVLWAPVWVFPTEVLGAGCWVLVL